MSKIGLSVGVIMMAAALGGCGEDVLRTSKNVTSLTAGQSETIAVEALDSFAKPVAFTAAAKGTCVTAALVDGGVELTAGTSLCDDEATVTAENGLEKSVAVSVYHPSFMDIGDGLLIRYTNQYEWRWNDKGSGGTYDVTYWHPLAGGGWYPLGSYISPNYNDINADANVPMILVQDSKNAGLLAAPTGYSEIYNDRGSGAYDDGSVWKPNCPAGYAALGVVTQRGYSPPSADDVRCVKSEYTTQGKVGSRVYYDVNTGAYGYLSVFDIAYPDYTVSPDDRAALQPGTNVACGGSDASGWEARSCDPAVLNLLLVPLPVVVNSDNDAEPKLTSKQPLDVSRPRFFSSVRVPFTLVPGERDPARVAWNIAHSPFYYVQREEVYTPIDILDNSQGTAEAEYHYQIATGFSQTDAQTFSQQVGLEITAGGECGFLGTGGKWEVKLSAQLGWEQSTATTYSETITRDFTFTVPPGGYAEVVQVTSQFRAVPATGTGASTQPFNLKSNIIKYLQL